VAARTVLNTFVVIPAYRPRLSQLQECLASLQWPAEKTIIVSNGTREERLTWMDVYGPTIIQDYVYPDDCFYTTSSSPCAKCGDVRPNISAWWHMGIFAAVMDGGATEVLLLNVDCLITPEGVEKLAQALYDNDVSLTGPDHRGICKDGQPLIRRDLKPIPWQERIPGFCMMLRAGRAPGPRAGYSQLDMVVPNLQCRWWYSDDHIEWSAKARRGTALIPGVEVKHPPFGGTLLDEKLQRYADEDLRRFRERWGSNPWV
jgi:hypothetical protein